MANFEGLRTTTPPTEADIRGETEHGRQAYNERRRMLRDRGLRVPPDLYDDDLDGAYADEAAAFEYSAARYWDQLAAEAARNAAQEREWTAQDEHANDK